MPTVGNPIVRPTSNFLGGNVHNQVSEGLLKHSYLYLYGSIYQIQKAGDFGDPNLFHLELSPESCQERRPQDLVVLFF